jgi:uncharacterized Fe-S radical SAM superfamily protein PflX
MNISISIDNYLHKFKKYPKATTLFELKPEDITRALLLKSCPLCGKKLYQNRKGDKWFCKSKVSNDKFMILDSTLKKYW